MRPRLGRGCTRPNRIKVSHDFWANYCIRPCANRMRMRTPCSAICRKDRSHLAVKQHPIRSGRSSMTEVSFVDTNILVYARDPRQERKQHLAAELIQRLWQERAGRTSVKVLNEYYTVITRKLRPCVDAEKAWDDVFSLMAWNAQPIDRAILIAAREIERRHSTSWWDALIVAAAQAQRCRVLLS